MILRHFLFSVIFLLFAFAAEGGALRLPAVAGCPARDANMLRLTMAALVKGAFHHLAGHVRIFRGNVHRAGHAASVPLPEAGAAGIPGMAGAGTLHLDIILAAAALLVVQTAGHGTV